MLPGSTRSYASESAVIFVPSVMCFLYRESSAPALQQRRRLMLRMERCALRCPPPGSEQKARLCSLVYLRFHPSLACLLKENRQNRPVFCANTTHAKRRVFCETRNRCDKINFFRAMRSREEFSLEKRHRKNTLIVKVSHSKCQATWLNVVLTAIEYLHQKYPAKHPRRCQNMYVILLGNIMHLYVHHFNLQLSLYYVARGFTLSF